MTTALATIQKPQLTQDVWTMIQAIAPVMKDSRLFGVATEAQAAAVMLKGHELGLSLTASFEFIHVIESKPTLAPRGALALILQSPLCDGVEIIDEADDKGNPTACTVTMKRKGGMTYRARFSMEDAKRAGLVKDGSGWTKYPALMMKWRSIGFAADVVFPDLLNGLKRADELGADLTPGGEVIEGSWSNVGSQPTIPLGQSTNSPERNNAVAQGGIVQPTVSQSQPVQPAYDSNRLSRLVDGYGAGAIMDANGGKIPGTNEELDAVEAHLGVAK